MLPHFSAGWGKDVRKSPSLSTPHISQVRGWGREAEALPRYCFCRAQWPPPRLPCQPQPHAGGLQELLNILLM